MVEKRKKCTVREGNFVEPCYALETILEPNSPSKKTGVVAISYFVHGKPSRSFIAAKSGEHREGGFCFSYCPMCGEDISAPFDREEKAPLAASDAWVADAADASGLSEDVVREVIAIADGNAPSPPPEAPGSMSDVRSWLPDLRSGVRGVE